MAFKKGHQNLKKRKNHLTDKQLAYVTARTNGKTKTEAKRLAGYSENVSTSLIENNKSMRSALLECMAKNGLGEQFLVDKLTKGLNAKKIVYATKDGQITDIKRIDDNETQHKYFRDTIEIRGDIKQTVVDTLNIGLINVPSITDASEWNKQEDDSNQELSSKLPSSESANINPIIQGQ